MKIGEEEMEERSEKIERMFTPETYKSEELTWRFLKISSCRNVEKYVVVLGRTVAWQAGLCLCTLVTLFIDTYDAVFARDMRELYTLRSALWGVFLLDALLATFHKLWGRLNRAVHLPPDKWPYISLDWLLLGISLWLYTPSYPASQVSVSIAVITLGVAVIRQYKVLTLLKRMTNTVGESHTLEILLGWNAIVLIVVNVFAVVWYVVGVTSDGERDTWMNRRSEMLLGEETPLLTYFLSYASTFCYFSRTVVVLLSGSSVPELLLASVFTMTGWFIFEVIISVTLLHARIKVNYYQFYYKTYLEAIKRHLEVLKAPQEEANLVLESYVDIWKHWEGLKEERILKRFPLCLQKDVLLDIYYEAFQHSLVLRDQSISLKRALSVVMKCEFFRQGDYIMRYGKTKSKMFYIATGVVQLMSELDGTSPLMALSSGTVLSGAAVVHPMTSNGDIRCASYSELRTLYIKDLFTTAADYPWDLMALLNQSYLRRIQAIKVREMCEKYVRFNYEDVLFNVHRERRIKWIKKRWRQLKALGKKTRGWTAEEIRKEVEEMPTDLSHTSRYLELLVMTEGKQLKTDFFCLRCRWPFVIDPNSSFLNFWNALVSSVILVESLVVPYYSAFVRKFPTLVLKLTTFSLIIYLVDLYIIFSTAVKTSDGLITDSWALIRYRLQRLRHLIDVVSSLPVGFFIYLLSEDDRLVTAVELSRTLKVYRVVALLLEAESNIVGNTLFIRYLRYSLLFLLGDYWLCCFLYLIACYREDCSPTSWISVARTQLIKFGTLEDILCFLDEFALSLYYATGLTLRTSLSVVRVQSALDLGVILLVTLASANLYALGLAELASTRTLALKMSGDFKNLLYSSKDFMTANNIPRSVVATVERYLYLQWEFNWASELIFHDIPLQDASPVLRNRVTKELKTTVETVPLFRFLGDANFTTALANSAKLYVLPAGLFVTNCGIKSPSLNIIRKGYVRVVSHDRSDLKKHPDGLLAGPGYPFPLAEFISKNACVVTIYTVTDCEVLTIKKEDFVKCLRTVPHMIQEVRNIRTMILQNKTCSKIDIDYEVVIPRMPIVNIMKSKRNEKGDYSGLSFLKLPYCLTPDGSFIVLWETARAAVAVFSAFFFTHYLTVVFPRYRRTALDLAVALDLYALLDVLLRFHTAFYDQNGILVTDSKDITFYYLRHSFVVDLLSTVPVYMVSLEDNLELTWAVLAVLKNIPLYRTWKLLNYLDTDPHRTYYILHMIKYLLFLTALGALLANALALHLCYFRYLGNDLEVSCDSEKVAQVVGERSPGHILLITSYTLACIYTNTNYPDARAMNSTEMYILVAASFLGLGAKTYFYLTTCTCKGSRESEFSTFSEEVSDLLKFVGREASNKEIKRKLLSHFSYTWEVSRVGKVRRTLSLLHPNIQSQVFFAMYGRKLLNISLLSSASESCLSALSTAVAEYQVVKGGIILDYNSINDQIYLLHKGLVRAEASAVVAPVSLRAGSAFGCFWRKGSHRQTVRFVAHYHCDLLVIPSSRFHEILEDFPAVREVFLEAIEPYKEFLGDKESSAAAAAPSLSTLQSAGEDEVWFSEQSPLYKRLELLLSYIVPYAAFVLVLFNLPQPSLKEVEVLLWVCDALTLLKMVLGMTVAYVDEETGRLVAGKRLIRLRYLKSWAGFWVDLLVLLPLVLLSPYFPGLPPFLFQLNRLLRVVTISAFMYRKYNSLETSIRSQWADVFALLPLVPYTAACLWSALVCPTGCYDRKGAFVPPHLHTFLYSLLQVSCLLTNGSNTPLEVMDRRGALVGSILILVMSTVVRAYCIICLRHLFETMAYIMSNYEIEMVKMVRYLKQRDLSPHLLQLAWSYGSQLWDSQRGCNIPKLFYSAPPVLRAELMANLYQHHLQTNYLFKDSHPAFIRQLSSVLEKMLYFPGYTIVAEGDVDGRMYFIHSGEIEVTRRVDEYREEVLYVVLAPWYFGLVQGLYDKQPHFYSYRARSRTVVLSLKRSSWEDLMATFPQDTRIIYQRSTSLTSEFELDRDVTHP